MKLGKMMLCLGLALCVLAGCAIQNGSSIPVSVSDVASVSASSFHPPQIPTGSYATWREAYCAAAMENLQITYGEDNKEGTLSKIRFFYPSGQLPQVQTVYGPSTWSVLWKWDGNKLVLLYNGLEDSLLYSSVLDSAIISDDPFRYYEVSGEEVLPLYNILANRDLYDS